MKTKIKGVLKLGETELLTTHLRKREEKEIDLIEILV